MVAHWYSTTLDLNAPTAVPTKFTSTSGTTATVVYLVSWSDDVTASTFDMMSELDDPRDSPRRRSREAYMQMIGASRVRQRRAPDVERKGFSQSPRHPCYRGVRTR